ncbi:hypothetical protein KRP22_008532 [Phytophthora ramorum]|uniref:RxLR effector protein n=1 Tax=Phytophthora ramorum TaxID=164328 RepID=H3H2L0_PHYRM|nr:Secreted RxLR effector protein 10 [Phytophthora ramorum]KAH7501889.1 Secreted RxLR effector protein 10 [Phytophthora ramorum]
MRLHIVFATVVLFLACINAVSAVSGTEKAKLMPVSAVDTRLLTAGQDGGADKRFLRTKTTTEYDGTEVEERAITVGNTLEKAKFYYWKTMGKRPGDIYQKYFKMVDPANIAESPKYKVWQRYDEWFTKAKNAQIIKNQKDALAARPT